LVFLFWEKKKFNFYLFCRMVMFRIFQFMFILRLGLCWMSQTVGLISSTVVNLAIAFR
jgi:hypothetical protein